MKVSYIAPFEHSWGTEEHVARAFEALGHDVQRVPELSLDGVVVEPHLWLPEVDLVLYTKGRGISHDLCHLWRLFERRGAQTASFHLDLYRGLARENRVDVADPFWSTGTVFTVDGDPDTAAWMAERGVNHRWLPAAVAHDETHEGSWRSEYDHDVVFVGAGGYHPEWPWRAQLIRLLHRKYGTRFKHYDHHPPIRGNDLNDLYATARVVVGDSLALPGHTNYFSDRYFETVGRGGFLIAPRVAGIEAFFTDGEHLALYDLGNPAALLDQIDFWLDHPEDARRIAAVGQAHVRAHHTYVHRVEQMLATLGLTVAA